MDICKGQRLMRELIRQRAALRYPEDNLLYSRILFRMRWVQALTSGWGTLSSQLEDYQEWIPYLFGDGILKK